MRTPTLFAAFPRALLWGLALNLGLLAGIAWLRRLPPHSEVKISSTQDSLIVYGKNRVGFFALRQFHSWSQAEAFMAAADLRLAPPTDASRSAISEVEVMDRKIVWGRGKYRKVIFAPDQRSAEVISEQLRYEGYVPGSFGYSISLQ